MEAVGRREPLARRVVGSFFRMFFLLLAASLLVTDSPPAEAQASGPAVTAPASAPASTPATAPAGSVAGSPPVSEFEPHFRTLITGKPDEIAKTIAYLSEQSDMRLADFLDGCVKSSLYLYAPNGPDAPDARTVMGGEERKTGLTDKEMDLLEPLTRQQIVINGKPLVLDTKSKLLTAVSIPRRLRPALGLAISLFKLNHADPEERRKAIIKAGETQKAEDLPAIAVRLEKLATIETNKKNQWTVKEALARNELEKNASAMFAALEEYKDAVNTLNGELRKLNDLEAKPADSLSDEEKTLLAKAPDRKAKIPQEIEAAKKRYDEANDEAKNPELVTLRNGRLAAAAKLGELRSLRSVERLKEAMAAEPNQSATATSYAGVLNQIANWQRVVDWSGYTFSGFSSASILIFMALGLAIIFGLMGVINMAHGEIMMVGAYSTFLVQETFIKFWPGAFEWYFLFAIPVSFVVAAIVGIIIEATVIRFLYGRPLDTLLATFGVSYILIQAVRSIFGTLTSVKAPTWLQGSWEPVLDIRLPYNRMFIMAFCTACVLLMYFIINRTRLGLLLRATTQNRTMAASLGVSTRKIDMLTFALGSGLAGMAGCALSQVGGVTPDMGQNYIIESFLVVVVGGVGKLAGAIWSGLGLGIVQTWMEPFAGTIWAKVLILTMVVIFVQRKPSGLFPARGRLADV